MKTLFLTMDVNFDYFREVCKTLLLESQIICIFRQKRLATVRKRREYGQGNAFVIART